jgi:hypothetical protein
VPATGVPVTASTGWIGMIRWRAPSTVTMPPHMLAQCAPPNRPRRKAENSEKPIKTAGIP